MERKRCVFKRKSISVDVASITVIEHHTLYHWEGGASNNLPEQLVVHPKSKWWVVKPSLLHRVVCGKFFGLLLVRVAVENVTHCQRSATGF